jgi:hypothetical protein
VDALTLTNRTTIWPEISDFLSSNYKILDAFNFLDYDYDIPKLWQALYKYKSYEFDDHERLIFTLYDNDYYLFESPVGVTIENWIRILNDLDISLSHCILLTSHHGLADSIKKRINSPWSVLVVENNFSTVTTASAPTYLSPDQFEIRKHFCFMSNVRRDHRSYIRLWLHKHNLESTTTLAWQPHGLNFENLVRSFETFKIDQKPGCNFISVTPFARVHDKIDHRSSMLTDLYNQYQHILEHSYRDAEITTAPRLDSFYAPWLARCFLNIVTETVLDYPYPYLTEKTFKCFWHCSPFILAGAAGSLRYLKSIGFQTFDTWINEDYDNIQDPGQRLLAILLEIEKISKWSLEHCQLVYNEMRPVLEHNVRHYRDVFCQDLLDQTIKKLSKQ